MAGCNAPAPRQLEFQDWEAGLFLHFGIRTFYEGHRDWDGRPMSAEAFNPTAFDADQWAATAAQAGLRYAVLTAKHHDGFALWPSNYTGFSVAASPWRGGRGDVVAEYVAACRNHGLKVGLYYSPAEWGQTSSFKKSAREYDDYFIHQAGELLTGYGPIDMLWFDGCGSEGHRYDWGRILPEIRRMQPGILLFNMGDPDYRWVGNEAGLAPRPCWNVVSRVPFSIQTDQADRLPEPMWLPAECDFRMRRENWFYSEADEDTVKSLSELVGHYYYSVGRGANFLINIGPDRRGLLPDKDAARLLELGSELRRRFARPLTALEGFARSENAWTWTPAATTLVDHVIAMEDLAGGEHVRAFQIEIIPEAGSRTPIVVYEGLSLGHKAICPFPPVKVRSLTLRVTEADGPVAMRNIQTFCTCE